MSNVKRILRTLLEEEKPRRKYVSESLVKEIIGDEDELLLGPGWIFELYTTPNFLVKVVKALDLDTRYDAVVGYGEADWSMIFIPASKLDKNKTSEARDILGEVIEYLNDKYNYIRRIPEGFTMEGYAGTGRFATKYYDDFEPGTEILFYKRDFID